MPPLESYAAFERFLGEFTNYERQGIYRYDKETLGLQRIRVLSDALGRPQDSFDAIHVAGTKGKGSTSLMLESLLRAESLRVGTYTSPHVEHLRERIRVDGRSVSEAALLAVANEAVEQLPPQGPVPRELFPTFFELMTALAFRVFERREVELAILEVGLGGRLDATNIVEPEWTVITSIGLEHTAQLGDTIAAIAGEKAGIVKPGIPLILGPVPPEAERVIRAVARERSAPIEAVLLDRVRVTGDQLTVRAAESELVVAPGAVRGPALRRDLAIALTVLEAALRRLGRTPDPDRLTAAIGELELPARTEGMFQTTPPVIIDAAHTRESIRALAAFLDEAGVPRPRTIVCSLSRGKDPGAITAELTALGDRFLFTRADAVRSYEPEELRDACGRGEVVPDPDEAFDRAVGAGDPVVVTGSFYLAGRLRPRLRSELAEPTQATPPPG